MSSRSKPIVNQLSGISINGLPTVINNTLQYDAINNVFNWVSSSSLDSDMVNNRLTNEFYNGGSTSGTFYDTIIPEDKALTVLRHTSNFIKDVAESMHLVDDSTPYQNNTSEVSAVNLEFISTIVVTENRVAEIWSTPTVNSIAGGTLIFESVNRLLPNTWNQDAERLTVFGLQIQAGHFITIVNKSPTTGEFDCAEQTFNSIKCFALDKI